MRRLCARTGRALIERTFREADLNSDGMLERGEFRRLMQVV